MIARTIYKDLKAHLSKKEITLLIGPRQVGKTTLMKKLHDEISKATKKIWFNLDIESDNIFFESQNKFLQKLELELGDEKGIIFIDEIQRKKNAGLFLKGIYDIHPQYKFILSGSGSMELREGVVESLAGRKRIFEITPVTFFEYVDYITDYAYSKKLEGLLSLEKEKTHYYLEQYILFGGYPAVITSETKKEKRLILSEILNSYLLRDIQAYLPIQNPRAYTQLLKLLAAQTSSQVKYSNLASFSNISANTVKEYMWYMVHTFIIRKSIPFFSNPLKELKKEPIAYFVDTGLMNFQRNNLHIEAGTTFGMIFQNFVFNELYYLLQNQNAELKYWRTKNKAEVDIIIDAGQTIIPIEVKYMHMEYLKISRGFRSFLSEYRPKEAFIVAKSGEFSEQIEDTTVRVVPFYNLGKVINLLQ